MQNQTHLSRCLLSAPPKRFLSVALIAIMTVVATGCTSVPLQESGTLTSYSSLSPVKGKFGRKRRLYVDAQQLARAKTVRIIPTSFSFSAASRIKAEANRALVSKALDRALCVALSDKYEMVPASQQADLTIRSVVTDIVPTNKGVAAAAAVASVGGGFAIPSDIPLVGIPRIPFGLGGLAVEAEAIDRSNVQRAAMLWSRGANFIQDAPRYSEVGDAYGLAAKFADDFSRAIVHGKEPNMLDISIPTRQRLQSWLGGKPKYAACEVFGRSPGLIGKVAGNYGLPPQWTDRKPRISPAP